MKKYLLPIMLLLGLVCSAQASAEEATAFTPSLPANQVLKIAETTEATMSPATSAEDNSHWYLVTQTRVQSGTPTATPMYDNGVGNTLYRADVSVTPASLNGKLLDQNTKYLVRFVQANDGTYYIQFADGNFIQNTLTTGDYTTAGEYVFYNINGTDGHFGWNLVGEDTKYGSIVDNNGAGYTMSFWDTGEVTWTDGNNDWSLYAVSFEEAKFVDVNYTLTDAAGNEFTGTYTANWNGDDTDMPDFTGATDATIEKTFAEKDGAYTLTGTITFPFPVSSETVKNATAIQSQNGSSLWYANSSDEVIADNSDNYAATYETQQNYNWYIYPCFADGAFTFKIYNIGAQKWMPTNASTSKSTATVLTAEETEVGQFPFLKVVSGNGFASNLTSRNYFCIETSGAGQYVYFRNMKTNSKNTGANLTFPEAVSISESTDPEPDPEPTVDISGKWYEKTTGMYYNSNWEDVSINNNPVTVTINGTTATFANLLGQSSNNLTATISGNTLTFAKGQTANYGGYEWDFGGEDADGAECDVTGTISEDGQTITINGINIWYSGWTYMYNMQTVLTREKGEEAVVETFDGYVRYLAPADQRSAYLPEDINATMTKSTLDGVTTYSIDNYSTSGYPYPSVLAFSVENNAISSFSGLYYGYAYYLTSSEDMAYLYTEGSVYDETQGYLSFPYDYYTSYNNTAVDESGVCYFVWGKDYVPTGINNVNAETSRNGKYLENNRIVIVKNGKKFNAAGMSIK